jgi:hypothetical protein
VSKHILGTMAGGAADCSFWLRHLAMQARHLLYLIAPCTLTIVLVAYVGVCRLGSAVLGGS